MPVGIPKTRQASYPPTNGRTFNNSSSNSASGSDKATTAPPEPIETTLAPPLPAGSYLVKVTVDGKVVGTKTILIEADSLQ